MEDTPPAQPNHTGNPDQLEPHRLQPEDYRYGPEDGIAGYGITCAVETLAKNRFRTNSMPTFAQPRVDAQGKTYGAALLRMEVEID